MREVLSANFRKRRRANPVEEERYKRGGSMSSIKFRISRTHRDRFDRVFEDNAIWSIHFFFICIPKFRRRGRKCRSPLEKFAGRTRRYRIARYEIENAAPKMKKKGRKEKKKRKKQEKKSFNPSRRDSTPKLPFRRPCPKKNPPLCSNKDLGKVILSE